MLISTKISFEMKQNVFQKNKSMKKSIGNRITISAQNQETIVRIDGTVESWMNHALLGWVIMWTLIGAYVANFVFFGDSEEDQFYFFLTYLAFWGYFEMKAVYSWLYRVKGYELIRIAQDGWYIKRAVFSFGKVSRYVKENIKDLEKVSGESKSITTAFNKSFWVMGNEQLKFEYFGKNVGIGMHLVAKDRDALYTFLRKELKRN
jgi:hypothetical protein